LRLYQEKLRDKKESPPALQHEGLKEEREKKVNIVYILFSFLSTKMRNPLPVSASKGSRKEIPYAMNKIILIFSFVNINYFYQASHYNARPSGHE